MRHDALHVGSGDNPLDAQEAAMAVNGKVVGTTIVGIALLAGLKLFYLEHFYWYDITYEGTGTLPFTTVEGAQEDVTVVALQHAEGASSPLKYRACFELPPESMARLAEFAPAPNPAPTVAPRPFTCFDAEAIAEALERGSATAVLGTTNTPYGIDRVVAVTDAGDAYAWHQINRCGERVFDGDPPPEGCPPPPQTE
ncbi:MAG: DUF6446 family protein [Pseudomonadota bacterium]